MRLLQLIMLGISLGALYSLIALSFVVIFKGTKVINLAQGSILLLGAYVVGVTSPLIGFWPAFLLGILTAMLGSLIVERLIAASRSRDHLVATILTIGVDILLVTEITRMLGAGVISLGEPWGYSTVTLGEVTIPVSRIVAISVSLLLIVGVFFAFSKTDWGIRMRAAAEDPEAAALMGVSQRKVSMTSWMLGGLLAAVAGVFLAGFPNPGLDTTAHIVALNAVPAVILGGLDSPFGAVVGGITVGVAQSVVTGFDSSLNFLGSGLGLVVPYLIMLAVLLVRPNGLFGTRGADRV